MKIAYVLPQSFENNFPKEINRFSCSDDLESEILVNISYYTDRICRASQMVGLEPILYYFSSLNKKKTEFCHKNGYIMKKMPLTLKKGKYGHFGWEYSYSLFKEISKDNVDLVFVFTYMLNCALPLDMYDLLSIYCRKKGLPLIARHSRDSANCKLNGTKIIFRNWIKKKTLNMADKIIIPSQSERLEVENLGINKNKLVSMQNPIDFNNFHPMPREEAAKILKRDTAYKYLLYVGRLHKNKGIQDVLNILPKLITNHPNIRFLIVGYGPYEDYLNEKVKEKNLQEFVNFEGLVLPENLIYYYNLSDAFVVPSYKDGGPNVIQEAIACNTSSIGTNVGIIPEVLSEGVGKLIDVKDELELFKGINDILNGKFQINQEKRRLLLEEWSLKRYGIQLKNICDEIIK